MWYQHDVRVFVTFAAVALTLLGCGGPTPRTPPSPSATSVPADGSVRLDPARIDRARGELPQGYEVTDAVGRIAPFAQWGLGDGWTADPPQCGALADPVAQPVTAKGWSGSGPGGIVYAVVAWAARPVTPDPVVIADCAHWAVAGGRTTAEVTTMPGPSIDDAQTVAMSTAATTVVEGGTETRSHADTVCAYLGDYAVLVTVVTDPGSPNPQLGRDFAAILLAKTVAQLRG